MSESVMPTPIGNIYSKVYKAAKLFGNGKTAVIYEREGRGAIVSMQFIGAVDTTISENTVLWEGFERTTLDVETDGNVFFSGRLYEFLGMNTDIADMREYPRNGFSTPFFTKGGRYSGITLNFRIPYYSGVRVILRRDDRDVGKPGICWVTVRDTDATDISCCGIQLPDRAYLHSVKTKGFLAPGEELYLLDTDKSGMLISLSLFGKSDTFNFVEGCLRARRAGLSEPIMISSGFEDYFGFCFGFNLGKAQFGSAGLTLYEMHADSVNPYRVSAYRNHMDDPITFLSGGFSLTLRNGDQNTESQSMAGNGTGNSDALMGGQVTYYLWK